MTFWPKRSSRAGWPRVPASDVRRTAALVSAQGRLRGGIVARLVALIVGMLTAYRRGPQSPSDTARLVGALVKAFEQGERVGVTLGSNLAAAVLPAARRAPTGPPQPITAPDEIQTEVERIVADWMATPEPDLQPVEQAVTDHVVAAERSGAGQSGVKGITGWRRVIHPELSRSGTCGLCVSAATRIYTTSDLKPLHKRCFCTVMGITADSDPGDALNRVDLGDLYDDAGGTTDGWTLKQTRYQVGPDGTLVAAKVRTKQGPRESAAQIQRRARLARKAKRVTTTS